MNWKESINVYKHEPRNSTPGTNRYVSTTGVDVSNCHSSHALAFVHVGSPHGGSVRQYNNLAKSCMKETLP